MSQQAEVPVYDPHTTESQAQQYWQEQGTYAAQEHSAAPKFYCLAMFPYPSGQLHMGHVRAYTLGDVIGRYQRLKGKNVMQPMGWDAFGLPAENAAIKHNIAPAQWTRANIDYMRSQLKRLGFAYDWSRELSTCDPAYYRWEQWLFTRMFKKGLVYKKSAVVNWDPVDQTVLANEQVIDGRGWRSDAPIERRELAQWFIKITDYAEELLDKLEDLVAWPDKIKTMQRNWIGRSEGVELKFPLKAAARAQVGGAWASENDALTVYTTRPDTLMGATYLAVAAQHPIARAAARHRPEVKRFIEQCGKVRVAEAEMAQMEKLGVNTGYVAEHPLSGADIPIWVSSFVLMEYGAGAVMSVPAHDQRDWEFARKYRLNIRQVVTPAADSVVTCDIEATAYVSKNGVLINSGVFDGLGVAAGGAAIARALIKKGLGKRRVNYRLRDWGVSRQRYWGCPIPIINCHQCGAVAVPEQDLPVLLPTDVAFDGVGSPIKKMPQWYVTTCPKCHGEARRETDTFDTFMESSWYYARFACADQNKSMLDARTKYWGSVDHYVGGEEHAILHLLYARFMHKVMRDAGLVESDEPFKKLLALGMVLKDGTKMSKSAGDAGDPQHLLDTYGADAVRMAMLFAAPPEQSFEWSEQGVEAAHRWLKLKFWHLAMTHLAAGDVPRLDKENLTADQKEMRRLVHTTLNKADDDYSRRLSFNTVVSSIMSLLNHLNKFADRSPQGRAVVREALTAITIIMSPITPHICHALCEQLSGKKLEDIRWMARDQSALTRAAVSMVVQVNGKLRGKFTVAADSLSDEVENIAKSLENVAKFIVGKRIRKVIVVPNKLVNLVVS